MKAWTLMYREINPHDQMACTSFSVGKLTRTANSKGTYVGTFLSLDVKLCGGCTVRKVQTNMLNLISSDWVEHRFIVSWMSTLLL